MSRLQRLVRLLPGPLNALAKWLRHAFDPLVAWLWRRRRDDIEPLPPSRLRARTGTGTNIAVFRETGARQAQALEHGLLEAVGRPLSDYRSILDWGCGCGRVLAHLRRSAAAQAALFGCDVDTETVDWARRHYPEVTWASNGYRPPLPFESASFDLIYSISILTHFGEPLQLSWLEDLARCLSSGGHALLSVMGPHAFEECRAGRFVSKSGSCARRIAGHRDLGSEGFIFEPYDLTRWNRDTFPGVAADSSYGMAFHSREYVERVWGQHLDVVAVQPRAMDGWQDLVVLVKR